MKLKNILYIGTLLFAATSCESYLDQPPVDLLSSGGFYQTAAQANQGILGVYADTTEGRADVNRDGEVGLADVNSVINFILN